MHDPSQAEIDLIDLDSPPATKAIHTQSSPDSIQQAPIPSLLIQDAQQPPLQLNPPRQKRKSKRARMKEYVSSTPLGGLDLVLEEAYDPDVEAYSAVFANELEHLADEDTSLEQNGNYLAGWVCNMASPASSRFRFSVASKLSASSSMDRPYVPRVASNRHSHASDDVGSVVSDLLGSTIADEDEFPRTRDGYSNVSIRSSLLSSSLSSSECLSQDHFLNVDSSVRTPYIKPNYRRSYEITIDFSVGEEVFLLDSCGNSVSWISPKKPRKDGGLLVLDKHTRVAENWYRKCNVYVISKMQSFRDPAASHNEQVYELIPDIGDDGHVRIPIVSKGDVLAVKFKPGDRVKVSNDEGEYNGTVGLAWVEGGERMYQVMPSGRRGFCRPAEECMRQIESRRKRWNIQDEAQRRVPGLATFKGEYDQYMTKWLRIEKAERIKK